MELAATKRGAVVAAVWWGAAVACVGVVLWLFVPRAALFVVPCAVLLAAACGYFHAASTRIYVGEHHVLLQRGVLFCTTRRLPLRFITGCNVLSTPLQRVTGTCLLVLRASGSITLATGISAAQAAALAERLCAKHTVG